MASIKEEIAAIATEHGYTGAAPKTIAGAIDALADTLAGEDVSSGRSIAGAIHALAPYIGAGSGAELGSIQGWLMATAAVPVVGQSVNPADPPYGVSVSVDQSVVVSNGSDIGLAGSVSIPAVAAGARVVAGYPVDDASFDPDDDGTLFYAVTAEIAPGAQGPTYASVRPLDVDYQLTSDEDYAYVAFTVPELGEGEQLACNVSGIGG